MKREDILNELGGVNEKYAAESKPAGRRSKTRWIRAAAAAAAVFVAVFGVYFGVRALKGNGGSEISAYDPTAVPTAQATTPAATEPDNTVSGDDTPRAYAQASYPETPTYESGNYYRFLNGLRDDGVMGCGTDLNEYYCRMANEILLSEKDNAVCSPYNIYMALAMLAEITDGNTRAQILDLLGADSIEALRAQYASVYEASYRNSSDIAVTIPAAAIFLNNGTGYNTSAIESLRDAYRASVFGGEMGDPEYDAMIKQWMDEQTHGLLSDMTGEAAKTDPGEVLKLISTLYFKAKWSDEFDKETYFDVFHAESGVETVEFMSGTADEFVDCEGYILVGKNMQDGSKMWFAMPKDGVSLDSVIADGALAEILKQRPDENDNRVFLNMPKLDIAYNASLIEALKKLGVTDCFIPGVADFSPLADADMGSLYVSSVDHGARLIADTDGVEAAAFTVIDVNSYGWIDNKLTVTLDRPFMFAVVSADNAPLFVGTVRGF